MRPTYLLFRTTIFLFFIVLFFSRCATIIGGTSYNAHVFVDGHPDAKISYKGINEKNGRATFKVKRSDANKLVFAVKDGNCEEQKFEFKSKSMRGWALAGSVLGWTGLINGVPLPWGVVVDFATGSVWKPNVNEKGVTKMDFKHYNYDLVYTGCQNKTTSTVQPVSKTKVQMLKDLKALLDSGALTKEEFEKEKKKVLDQE